jgi:subtilisin-like proprotein convertase family protein
MKLRNLLVFTLLSSALSVPASTLEFSNTPGSTNIADNTYNGTLASMASTSVNVPASGTITRVGVRIGVSHTWAGDLTLKLRSPVGTIVTLMSRPGVLETADDGNDALGVGDSSNLLNTFPITFDDLAASSAETMGNTLTNGGVVCQDDARCSYAPNPGAATPGNLSSFNAQNSQGIWTLYAGDSVAGDTGSITSVTMIIDSPDFDLQSVSLQISQSGTNVVLAWPTNAAAYFLESTPSLGIASWNSVTNDRLVNGTNFTITLPTSPPTSFFRLHKPEP